MRPTTGDQPPSPVTPAMEDYVKAVYHLQRDAGSVTTHHLAEAVGVSAPSVTKMVKRLHELGLLRHTRYRGVELTESGRRIALEVVHHHLLLESYLVEALGFPCDEAHAEAERLEHHVSQQMEARLEAALRFSNRDQRREPLTARLAVMTSLRGDERQSEGGSHG